MDSSVYVAAAVAALVVALVVALWFASGSSESGGPVDGNRRARRRQHELPSLYGDWRFEAVLPGDGRAKMEGPAVIAPGAPGVAKVRMLDVDAATIESADGGFVFVVKDMRAPVTINKAAVGGGPTRFTVAARGSAPAITFVRV